LPNANINVIGVGWTLGVIFVFYLMFPFFVFLLKNKRRAWVALMISILLRIICSKYFFSSYFVVSDFSRHSNFLYNSVYFVLGGLLYLYRDNIICVFASHKRITFVVVLILGICSVISYQCGVDVLIFGMGILFFSAWIMYAISCPGFFLTNNIIRKISCVSLEIYLSHMLIFRAIELIGVSSIMKNYPTINYLFVTLIVVISTITFSIVANKILVKLQTKKCK